MNPAQTAFLEALRPILGPKGITTDPALIAPWEIDWRRRFSGHAPAIIAPTDTGQVQAVLRAAAEHRVPLVPQGGNSSMVGGATPPADGSALILSMRRMNRIRRIDAGAGMVVAEAGVILADLQAAVEGEGMRFPLTLGAKGNATVGGLVSTNAGGTQVLRFGTMRGLTLGVEAVLPDGTLYDGLSALKKDNRGYDLGQLLIGAEGTLGIVTAAALRLAPGIARSATAWVGLSDPGAGLTLLRRLQAASDMIESFEILPAESLAAAIAHLPGARSPLDGAHPWHVLIEAVTGDAQADPTTMLETHLARAIEDGVAGDAVIAASQAQSEAFWLLRHSLSDAERALGPAVQHDIAVPVDAMPRFMVEAAATCDARFPGTHASGFGHLGDGNIHFHVRAAHDTDRDRFYAEEAATITRFVHDLVTAAGGTISAEHGIGQMKRDELARLSPERVAAIRAIKTALDPHGLFNPGKLVACA